MVEIIGNTSSIVVIGSLNPAIFQPAWLRQYKVIGEAESEKAENATEVEVIHPELSILNLRNMKLIVDPNRFSLTVLEAPFERGFDFAVAVFKLLEHTPVTAIGLNREVIFRCQSVDAWHSLGDALAPKQPWNLFLGNSVENPRNGGLRSITMERGPKPDRLPGYTRVEVTAQNSPRDTKLSSNDHYDLKQENRPVPATAAIRCLKDNWADAMEEANSVFKSLVKLAEPEAEFHGL